MAGRDGTSAVCLPLGRRYDRVGSHTYGMLFLYRLLFQPFRSPYGAAVWLATPIWSLWHQKIPLATPIMPRWGIWLRVFMLAKVVICKVFICPYAFWGVKRLRSYKIKSLSSKKSPIIFPPVAQIPQTVHNSNSFCQTFPWVSGTCPLTFRQHDEKLM